MIKKLLHGYYWMKAFNLIKKERYLDASNYMIKIDENYVKDNFNFFICKGFVLLNLRELEYALRVLDKAEYILTLNNKKLNQDSINYILLYIYNLKDFIYTAVNRKEESDFCKRKKGTLSFSLLKVEKEYKRNYPVIDSKIESYF